MKVTKENFASAIKILGSRSAGFKSVMADVVLFGYEQATMSSNSSPLMVIRESLPNWVKPAGCTVKRLDEFVAEYCGFEWNKESKSYKKIPGKNLRELPDQGVKFWDYSRDEVERKPYNGDEAMDRLIARLVKETGWTKESALERFADKLAASALPSEADANAVAATLGLAA